MKTLEELTGIAEKVLDLVDKMQNTFAADNPENYREYLKLAIMVGLYDAYNAKQPEQSLEDKFKGLSDEFGQYFNDIDNPNEFIDDLRSEKQQSQHTRKRICGRLGGLAHYRL